MDADSITGSPISRDVSKIRKANLLRKLKHCKVDGTARPSQHEEEEEAFVDVSDDSSDEDYSDALMRMFNEEEPTSQSENNESTSPDEKKEDDDDCPLCGEKMDATDLLFKPCASCEYKMCLFCYKKINEGTGACPGCRKKYENQQTSSSNSGEASFQQRGSETVPLTSSFQGLGDSDD